MQRVEREGRVPDIQELPLSAEYSHGFPIGSSLALEGRGCDRDAIVRDDKRRVR